MGTYHTTSLITHAFDEAGIHYEVRRIEGNGPEEVKVGFAIQGGPPVIVRFISTNEENDLSVRIISLLNNVAEEKRSRIMEACNYLNTKRRFLCFSIDNDGDLNIGYDFLEKTDDCCLGNAAIEIFLRTMQILQEDYPVLMKALYTDEEISYEGSNIRRITSKDRKEIERKTVSESEDKENNKELESSSDLQELLLQRLNDDTDPSVAN